MPLSKKNIFDKFLDAAMTFGKTKLRRMTLEIIYCYSPVSECHFTNCSAVCRYFKRHSAECHSAYCHFAECHSAYCHFA
jgi:hypothetical protein